MGKQMTIEIYYSMQERKSSDSIWSRMQIFKDYKRNGINLDKNKTNASEDIS